MTWEVILGVNMILLVLFSVLFASFFKIETGNKIALITVFFCFVLIGIIGLVFLAYYIGYYDCKNMSQKIYVEFERLFIWTAHYFKKKTPLSKLQEQIMV